MALGLLTLWYDNYLPQWYYTVILFLGSDKQSMYVDLLRSDHSFPIVHLNSIQVDQKTVLRKAIP